MHNCVKGPINNVNEMLNLNYKFKKPVLLNDET